MIEHPGSSASVHSWGAEYLLDYDRTSIGRISIMWSYVKQNVMFWTFLWSYEIRLEKRKTHVLMQLCNNSLIIFEVLPKLPLYWNTGRSFYQIDTKLWSHLDWLAAFLIFSWYYEKVKNSHYNVRNSHFLMTSWEDKKSSWSVFNSLLSLCLI